MAAFIMSRRVFQSVDSEQDGTTSGTPQFHPVPPSAKLTWLLSPASPNLMSKERLQPVVTHPLHARLVSLAMPESENEIAYEVQGADELEHSQ